MKGINNKYINNYNRIHEDNIKNQIKLLNKIMDDKNNSEFFTYFGNSLTLLFIDEKLIISFLESLPKEYAYHIKVMINVRGYGSNEVLKIIEVFPDEFDYLLERFRNIESFQLNWIYLKIYNWYMYIFIRGLNYIDEDKELKDKWYNEINALYYANMPLEERELLRTIENIWAKNWKKEHKI